MIFLEYLGWGGGGRLNTQKEGIRRWALGLPLSFSPLIFCQYCFHPKEPPVPSASIHTTGVKVGIRPPFNQHLGQPTNNIPKRNGKPAGARTKSQKNKNPESQRFMDLQTEPNIKILGELISVYTEWRGRLAGFQGTCPCLDLLSTLQSQVPAAPLHPPPPRSLRLVERFINPIPTSVDLTGKDFFCNPMGMK